MNDRFKFRCWDKENKKFLHPLSFDICYNGTLIINCGIEGKKYINLNDTDRYILMQCTGLKDKNGKLIYEGDILQQPQLPHKVVCEWYKDGYWLNGFMNGAKRELRNMHNWYEVIGNIYEIPELLKECEDE